MKRPTRFPAWLERRRYSIHTKKRMIVGSVRPAVAASSDVAPVAHNVIPFVGRETLRAATPDCPEVSVMVIPLHGLRASL